MTPWLSTFCAKTGALFLMKRFLTISCLKYHCWFNNFSHTCSPTLIFFFSVVFFFTRFFFKSGEMGITHNIHKMSIQNRMCRMLLQIFLLCTGWFFFSWNIMFYFDFEDKWVLNWFVENVPWKISFLSGSNHRKPLNVYTQANLFVLTYTALCIYQYCILLDINHNHPDPAAALCSQIKM